MLIRAASIARRFYVDNRSKVDIAEELGISRFKVARMLEHARSSGLVHIEIAVPSGFDAELSDALRTTFGLHEAIVVTAADGADGGAREQVGRAAASYLTEVTDDGDVIGLACSGTLRDMANSLTKLGKVAVVQLTGACPLGAEHSSADVVQRVAGVVGGPVFPIHAPLIIRDSAMARRLRRTPHVVDAMSRYRDVTKAVVAIGSWKPDESSVCASLTGVEADSLRQRGVRAEVCGRAVDKDGNDLPALANRVIAITARELRRVPEVIAVAAGTTKAPAIKAVLKGGLVDSLVTDADTARRVLAPDIDEESDP